MKKIIYQLILIILVFFFAPLLILKLASADLGLIMCMILFFAVNPLVSIVCGIFAGFNVNKNWFMPIVAAVIFLLSTWLLFEMWEMAFLIYPCAYLLIGYISMLATHMIKKILNDNKK